MTNDKQRHSVALSSESFHIADTDAVRIEGATAAMAQQEHGDYCPFLNRTDDRCSNHFQLDHLGEAFEHCFGGYHACAIYQELLRERQTRRAAAAADARISDRWNWTPPRASYAPKPAARSLVQLTIARRFDFAEAAD